MRYSCYWYISITQKQSTNRWRHFGSPRCKNFMFKNLLLKFLLPFFRFTKEHHNGNHYSTLLTSLRKIIIRSRLGKLPKGMLFLQDNGTAHKSDIGMQIIHDQGSNYSNTPLIPQIELRPTFSFKGLEPLPVR